MNNDILWKSAVGYEGFYEVSNTGIVRSVDREVSDGKGGIKHLKSKICTQAIDRNGYATVRLNRDCNSIGWLVHRIVALAFIDNPDNRELVNHKDFNRSNNHVDNLEWVSRSENVKHAINKAVNNRPTTTKKLTKWNDDMLMGGEIWKPLIGISTEYEVSNYGRFRSIERDIDTRHIYQILLTPHLHNTGYISVPVKAWIDGQYCRKLAHYWVAQTFIPTSDNKLIVNHKNGIKTDNRVENLEWVTYSENQQHVYDCLNRKLGSGTDNGNAKLTDEQILDIKKLYATGTHTHKSLALLYNVNKDTIYRHLRVNHKHIN